MARKNNTDKVLAYRNVYLGSFWRVEVSP